ncbi:MAG: YajQ family cyclic di-GMP-binding protein [Acidimicrobiaceae bacterium]|nr:YajQ family cyclic di-GMP-binding protein [Acidimicrobiaceae bacterium]MCY4176274.1 YajQ family cyclic di-GMP-binding protein [Acidimicrobiaceae bacterium]MCY4280252.1 YajQ family cyclic di-GMP-binding protein [Acidimicrobiaceae bacterium]
MPTFDIVNQLDLQEVRNAVDQAAREVSTRYDFRNTGTTVELGDGAITLNSSTEDRLTAARTVLEEKLVRRKVSLKALDYGTVQETGGAKVRQVAALRAGISSEHARRLNKFIKDLGIKGLQSSTQGDQLRVQSKKRDDLQTVIAALKEGDFDVPMQYVNFRD